jgi:hypothetical protein
MCAVLISYKCDKWAANLIIHCSIILVMYGEEYHLWSSLLRDLLHFPVTSYFLSANVHLRNLMCIALKQYSYIISNSLIFKSHTCRMKVQLLKDVTWRKTDGHRKAEISFTYFLNLESLQTIVNSEHKIQWSKLTLNLNHSCHVPPNFNSTMFGSEHIIDLKFNVWCNVYIIENLCKYVRLYLENGCADLPQTWHAYLLKPRRDFTNVLDSQTSF